MPIRIIKNVPAHRVDTIIRANQAAGATHVDKLLEPDGEFTLIVTFPDYETHAAMLERQGGDDPDII